MRHPPQIWEGDRRVRQGLWIRWARDCPLLLVGFAQLWGHPLNAGPANWYSPDMPTTFEQRLPVTVSLIVIEYLPVNSQLIDEALRFPWLAADSEGSRPRIRDDVARQSDLMSLGVPR